MPKPSNVQPIRPTDRPPTRPLHQRIDDQRLRVFRAAGIVEIVAERILAENEADGAALEGALEMLNDAAMDLDALESETRPAADGGAA
jgi:hypothetical protein